MVTRSEVSELMVVPSLLGARLRMGPYRHLLPPSRLLGLASENSGVRSVESKYDCSTPFPTATNEIGLGYRSR